MREWSETRQNTYSMYFLLGKISLLTDMEGFVILVCFNLFHFITLQLLVLYANVQCANLL